MSVTMEFSGIDPELYAIMTGFPTSFLCGPVHGWAKTGFELNPEMQNALQEALRADLSAFHPGIGSAELQAMWRRHRGTDTYEAQADAVRRYQSFLNRDYAYPGEHDGHEIRGPAIDLGWMDPEHDILGDLRREWASQPNHGWHFDR